MIFYIIIIVYLAYRLFKTKSPAVLSILLLAFISGAHYMGWIENLIYPLPYIAYGAAVLTIVACLFFTWKEWSATKRDFLASRRRERERNVNFGEDKGHEKIVIRRSSNNDEKVLYIKRDSHDETTKDIDAESEKNVPHGTINRNETSNSVAETTEEQEDAITSSTNDESDFIDYKNNELVTYDRFSNNDEDL